MKVKLRRTQMDTTDGIGRVGGGGNIEGSKGKDSKSEMPTCLKKRRRREEVAEARLQCKDVINVELGKSLKE
jgi:hypothetical protein